MGFFIITMWCAIPTIDMVIAHQRKGKAHDVCQAGMIVKT